MVTKLNTLPESFTKILQLSENIGCCAIKGMQRSAETKEKRLEDSLELD